MRKHVEQPAARGLAERLEVASPDLLRASPAVPHAVVVHINRALAHEVHRPDHIVEVARFQQVGHAILGAGHEVRLDAQAQIGPIAHERAVGVQIVVRVPKPERMPPHLERLLEAVDVFGDPELGDPRSLATVRYRSALASVKHPAAVASSSSERRCR